MEEFSELTAYLEELAPPPFITCQMVSGEQMEVEIHPEMSYFALYQAISDSLPREIRPRFIEQMNLFVEGKWVPWYHDQRVVPSSEVYHLVLDTVSYNVVMKPIETLVHSQGMNYKCWECYVGQDNQYWTPSSNEPGSRSWEFYFLYDVSTQSFLSLDDAEYKFSSEDSIDVWIKPDQPHKNRWEIFHELMGEIEREITPSFAGMTLLRQEVRFHMTQVMNAVINDEDEEEDEDE